MIFPVVRCACPLLSLLRNHRRHWMAVLSLSSACHFCRHCYLLCYCSSHTAFTLVRRAQALSRHLIPNLRNLPISTWSRHLLGSLLYSKQPALHGSGNRLWSGQVCCRHCTGNCVCIRTAGKMVPRQKTPLNQSIYLFYGGYNYDFYSKRQDS